jgi:2,3-bisphosphoglycerate-independent phosphoglycerate mutase
LKGLCDAAKANHVKNVFIHAFMDGRDTDPASGLQFIQELNAHLEHSAGTIASAIGRYYAMDRDNRWERVKLAYDLMVHGTGKPSNNISESIQQSYDAGISDEFIDPIVKTDNDGIPVGKIEQGDVVICFNFRTDRGREITSAINSAILS